MSSSRRHDVCSDPLFIQWMAAGGRGLRPGCAPLPAGRGFSSQTGSAIAPPLNMAVDTVMARAVKPAFVRVPVLVTHTQTHTQKHTPTNRHTWSESLSASSTVNGFWTGWSSWSECSSSCIPDGRSSVKTRHRSCSNPEPSSTPPGAGCPDERSQAEECTHLPYCPGTHVWSNTSPTTLP